MSRPTALLSLGLLLAAVPLLADGQEELVASARSAGPSSVSADATVINWKFEVVVEGTNEWTCLPDNPDTPGVDPWCVNDPWLNLLEALVNKKDPSYTEIGFAYMLMGDTPVSNTDPYASEKTTDEDWVEDLHSHLMMLIPNKDHLKGISTDAHNGGPWIMWPDTPYAHIMIPIDPYPVDHAD
ncbi:MAG: hypothetical protein O6951_05015 [Actinobacteria bacterium]|nr:hypothetical protein [Actinomycetota bacterium]